MIVDPLRDNPAGDAEQPQAQAPRSHSSAELTLDTAARLLELAAIPLLVIDRAGRLGFANPAARALESWLKQSNPTRDLAAELDAAIRHKALDGSASNRVVLRHPFAASRAYRVAIQPLDDGARAVALLEATDEGQANREIEQARLDDIKRQLLQADRMASIGQLAAGVAHEINNPIGYIQSNLGTLREYVADLFRLIETQDEALHTLRETWPELLQPVDAVRNEIDIDFLLTDLPTLLAESLEGIARVRKIIQDLRDFSRAGHAEDWTLADLHAGIDSTINIVWNDLKYKVDLVKQYGELPLVECLPTQLNQVFLNILVNAGHAIEERGQILIRTYRKGEWVYIEISDTGKGIAEDHLSRIFEPFFTTKPIGKGTGLGLSISYGIIKKHGGDIDVRSELGVGTTFVISLPIRRVAAASAAPGQA